MPFVQPLAGIKCSGTPLLVCCLYGSTTITDRKAKHRDTTAGVFPVSLLLVLSDFGGDTTVGTPLRAKFFMPVVQSVTGTESMGTPLLDRILYASSSIMDRNRKHRDTTAGLVSNVSFSTLDREGKHQDSTAGQISFCQHYSHLEGQRRASRHHCWSVFFASEIQCLGRKRRHGDTTADLSSSYQQLNH